MKLRDDLNEHIRGLASGPARITRLPGDLGGLTRDRELNVQPRGMVPGGGSGLGAIIRRAALRGMADYQFTMTDGSVYSVDEDGNETQISGPIGPTITASDASTQAAITAGQNPYGTVTVAPVAVTATGAPTADQAATIAQLAAKTNDPASVGWLSALANAVPKALQLYNAQQIAAVNIQRAQQGLAPLNPALYGPQVGVALSPGTSSLILYGAIGLGALVLIKK